MGLWAMIREVWSDDGYREDRYSGDKYSGKHEHSWYEVGKDGVKEGSVSTNEKTGEHTSSK